MQVSKDVEHWSPIGNAPRDGSEVRIGWADNGKIQEWYLMKWNHFQLNALFPGVKGMWIASDGSFTWNESDDEGSPTHWQPITAQETN